MAPAIGGTIAGIVALVYFVYFWGGMTKFFSAAKRSDGDLAAFVVIFGVCLTAIVVLSLFTIALMSRVVSELEKR